EAALNSKNVLTRVWIAPGGHPHTPRQGLRPLHPFGWEGYGDNWGTPPNHRRGDPCTPFEERLGDTPKPPAGRHLHPLLGVHNRGTSPNPRQGDPCTPSGDLLPFDPLAVAADGYGYLAGGVAFEGGIELADTDLGF